MYDGYHGQTRTSCRCCKIRCCLHLIGCRSRWTKGKLGNTSAAGICHSFTADGRCITLLKVLLSNACIYNCAYCVNRISNEGTRTTFKPRELADLTISFYRRNYIEGLFLSSGVVRSPDFTTELMIEALSILREEYGFRGYIHAKAVSLALRLNCSIDSGRLADRMSVNLELPSQKSLQLLAPDKSKHDILHPMRFIKNGIEEARDVRALAEKNTVYLSKRDRSIARPVDKERKFVSRWSINANDHHRRHPRKRLPDPQSLFSALSEVLAQARILQRVPACETNNAFRQEMALRSIANTVCIKPIGSCGSIVSM